MPKELSYYTIESSQNSNKALFLCGNEILRIKNIGQGHTAGSKSV